MNPNAYRGYQFVKAWEESLINGDSTIEPVGILSGDFDTPATIIEAVREWQEATFAFSAMMYDPPSKRTAAFQRERKATATLKGLRLPPVEEAK